MGLVVQGRFIEEVVPELRMNDTRKAAMGRSLEEQVKQKEQQVQRHQGTEHV